MAKKAFLILCLALTTSCGYTFQNSKNPLAESEGVRKVYINPVLNDTYKAGVENVVYNALVKTLTAHRRVQVVQSPEDADAVLQGKISAAQYVAATSRPANQLNPAGGVSSINATVPAEYQSIYITDVYSAVLGCSFSLIRRNPSPGKKSTVWASSFSRSKLFQSANQLGNLGNTAGLIDESEFDRTLADLAKSMMYDVHESMLVMF